MPDIFNAPVPFLPTLAHCIIALLAEQEAKRLEIKRADSKLYYKKNAERVCARINAFRRAHPEFHRKMNLAYAKTEKGKRKARESRLRNPETTLRLARKYRTKYPERYKEYTAKWRAKNLEYVRQRDRDWSKNNPEKRRAKSRRYQKIAYARPEFKVKMAMYRAINKTIARKHTTTRTQGLIGCDYKTLMAHLESQFTPRMNWSNYGLGGWTIDHKTPVTAFNLTDPNQIAVCFHYSNLQPLWWDENIRKSNKILTVV